MTHQKPGNHATCQIMPYDLFESLLSWEVLVLLKTNESFWQKGIFHGSKVGGKEVIIFDLNISF